MVTCDSELAAASGQAWCKWLAGQVAESYRVSVHGDADW
jgi:hypothetical protein